MTSEPDEATPTPNTLRLVRGVALEHTPEHERPVVLTEARPQVTPGDVRPIEGWYFGRDRARLGPRLDPDEILEEADGVRRRRFVLTTPGIYLADGSDAQLERAFVYVRVRPGSLERLEREQAAAILFARHGLAELEEAAAEQRWARAWEWLHYAGPELEARTREELFEAMRQALTRAEDVALEGRPKQQRWALRLRRQALALLRALYQNFVVDPRLPAAHPRCYYALLTAAWNMKHEPRARTWIGSEYHIERGDVVELVDRFASNGARLHRPRGRAERLLRADLELLGRLRAPR